MPESETHSRESEQPAGCHYRDRGDQIHSLTQMDVAVHDGRLEERRVMKHAQAVQLEAWTVGITEAVSEKASAASDKRTRLAKEEGRQESHEESRARMATFADLVREDVVGGLRYLVVSAVNILDDRIVAATNQIPGGQSDSMRTEAMESVEEVVEEDEVGNEADVVSDEVGNEAAVALHEVNSQ